MEATRGSCLGDDSLLADALPLRAPSHRTRRLASPSSVAGAARLQEAAGGAHASWAGWGSEPQRVLTVGGGAWGGVRASRAPERAACSFIQRGRLLEEQGKVWASRGVRRPPDVQGRVWASGRDPCWR